MKKTFVLAYLVVFGICSLFADNNDLLTGLNAYSSGDWSTATKLFEQVLTTGEQGDRTEARYWLVMAEGSAQNYQRALTYADAFLEAAPEDMRAAEVYYQKGRILHLSGDYETSSKIFYQFIAEYPEHPKIPSAYYWIGENFYSVGKFVEARKIFSEVVVNYPQSGKVSEARYKIVLIDQQSVRDELSRMASAVHTASAQTENTSESVVPEAKSKPDAVQSAAVASNNTVKPDAAVAASSVGSGKKAEPAANEASAAVAANNTVKPDAAVAASSADSGKKAEPAANEASAAVAANNTVKPDAAVAASSADSGKKAEPAAKVSPPVKEQRSSEYFSDRLTTVKKKLDEIAATLSLIEEEQESRRIRERQQSFDQQQEAAQLQKEQAETERQQLEKRRKELAELIKRTKTLKKLYEQRMKGAK